MFELIIVVGAIVFALLSFFLYPWFSARRAGVHITLQQLIRLQTQQVSTLVVVRNLVKAHKAGLSEVSIDDLEAHYIAGGNVGYLVSGMVKAKNAGIALSIEQARQIEIMDIDVFEQAKRIAFREQKNLNADHVKALFMAGGNVENAVLAVIEAYDIRRILSFRTAGNIVLAGHDAVEAVLNGVNPLTGEPFETVEITN